jgi:predicted extracellular nuclease
LPTSFSAKNTLRTGAQLQNVQGILEYRYNQWRIQPVLGATAPQVLDTTNPRASVPAKATQQVRVAAFNVLNYDNGLAQGFPTERGASSEAEFKKQHLKIVSALKAIDADVYGLMEIANNGYGERSAVAYLAQALGSDWKYVTPPNADKLGLTRLAL